MIMSKLSMQWNAWFIHCKNTYLKQKSKAELRSWIENMKTAKTAINTSFIKCLV